MTKYTTEECTEEYNEHFFSIPLAVEEILIQLLNVLNAASSLGHICF